MAKKLNYIVNGVKKSITLTNAMLKQIARNKRLEYEYQKSFSNKKDIVDIRGVRSIRKILETKGNEHLTAQDIKDLIAIDTKALHLPESLKRKARAVNRTAKKNKHVGRINIGGVYYQYKVYGYKETNRMLNSALQKAKGLANDGQIWWLINFIDEAVLQHMINRNKSLNSLEAAEIKHLKAHLKRHVSDTPYDLIESLRDVIYEIKNSSSPEPYLVGQLEYMSFLLETNGLY